MKNLANCKPTEFFVQTNRIRKSASKWLKDTRILEIRKIMPVLNDDMDEDEKKEALEEQARKNAWQILDSIMDENAEGTMELLALMCFVEPKDIDEHTVKEYLKSFTELINDQDVMDFFTSLMQLVAKIS